MQKPIIQRQRLPNGDLEWSVKNWEDYQQYLRQHRRRQPARFRITASSDIVLPDYHARYGEPFEKQVAIMFCVDEGDYEIQQV